MQLVLPEGQNGKTPLQSKNWCPWSGIDAFRPGETGATTRDYSVEIPKDLSWNLGELRKRLGGGLPELAKWLFMKIDIPLVNENPSDADLHFLDDRINEYNVETTGITDGRILSFLIRDERAEIIAGLYGWTWGAACEIRYLWVRKDMRQQGYGKALMVSAEHEAVLRGCSQIVLDTHSFQAPRFYERLGFEIIGSHPDYPRGHLKHYLRKPLPK